MKFYHNPEKINNESHKTILYHKWGQSKKRIQKFSLSLEHFKMR